MLLAVLLGGCQAAVTPMETASPTPTPARVKLPLARVERGNLSTRVSVSGVVEALPDHLVHVRPLAGGRIEEFLVVEGQQVGRGQLLARLNSEAAQHRLAAAERTQEGAVLGLGPLRAAVAAARADQQRVRAELDLAKANQAREEALFHDQVSAKKDLLAARSQVAVWQAQLRASQAALLKAEADLRSGQGQLAVHDEAIATARSEASFLEARAPISGVVTARSLNVGDFADPATPLLQIGDFSRVQLRLAVPVDLPIQLLRGQRLPVAGRSAQVLSVSPVANRTTNTYSVLLSLDNSDGRFHEGQNVEVALGASEHRGVLIVNSEALVPDPEEPAASMVCLVEDGRLKRVPVKVGVRSQQRVEVSGPLKAGQTVVARGGYGYPDGTLVEP